MCRVAWKTKIVRAEEMLKHHDRFDDQSSIISAQFFEMDRKERSFSRSSFDSGIISRVNV